jgi:tight adherence protein C
MVVFLIGGLMFLALAVGAAISVASSRRLRTAERLSSIDDYGFAVEASAPMVIRDGDSNEIAELVTLLGNFAQRRLGTVSDEEVRALLMRAGMYTTSPGTILGYRVLCALIVPALAIAALGTSPLWHAAIAIIAVGWGWMLPLVLVQRKARLRLRDIDRRLPDLIDLLCVMVEAGLGFGAALRMASEKARGPLADEVRLTLQEQTMGLAVESALGNLANRADTPAMRSFVRSIAQGERMGISTGQIMRNLSHEMRQRRRRSAEEQAQKAPIKMLFPLVFMIFPSLFLVLVVPAFITLLNSSFL